MVHYRLRDTLGGHWKQSISYGKSEALLYQRFAAFGMQRRPASAVMGDLWWLCTRLPFALPVSRRGAWLKRLGIQYGRVVGSIRGRVLWL